MSNVKKSNQRTKKDPLDRYYTPAWVTEILVENWPFPDPITMWEPCAGQGHIAKVLRQYFVWPYCGVGVIESDVDPDSDGYTHDFLKNTEKPFTTDRPFAIVTNPPYTIPGATAADFVRKALEYTPYVAMLLRLSWLEACEDRKSIFAEQPPAEVWILPRVKFEGPNTSGGSPSSTSAWFIWRPGTTKTKLMWVGGKP